MPRAKKKTTIKKRTLQYRRGPTDRRKNIVGNFKGEENIFWTKVIKGFKKLLSPVFPKQ
jgi:hypothetical protein